VPDKGPSASWYAVTGGGILFAILVLLVDGVYWPLALLPLVALCFWKARQQHAKGRGRDGWSFSVSIHPRTDPAPSPNEPLRFTPDQADLLRSVVAESTPQLQDLANRVIRGSTITGAQADELEGFLLDAAFRHEDRRGSLTERGKAIDGLLGIVASHREDFFD
jgi:hypothetical protein